MRKRIAIRGSGIKMPTPAQRISALQRKKQTRDAAENFKKMLENLATERLSFSGVPHESGNALRQLNEILVRHGHNPITWPELETYYARLYAKHGAPFRRPGRRN